MKYLLRTALACSAFIPLCLMADTPKGMMLYLSNSAVVNGKEVTTSSAAVFPNDTVQTAKNHARVAYLGADVAVDEDTLIKVGADFVELNQGSLMVMDNNAQIEIHAGDVLIMPADVSPTQFQIRDVNHRLEVIAQKGDLIIKDCRGHRSLAEGKEGKRDDRTKCGAAPPDAKGPLLDTTEAKVAGGVVGAGLLIWLLQGGPSNPTPASPVQP
jgi:hypothetical protein